MTQTELNEILERHQHWLKEDCDGWEDMKANLSCADLRGADLRGANLWGANLRGADLRGANLWGARNLNLTMACPTAGAFIGWKKAHGYIVKLQIPAEARRSSATTSKCRCDRAIVLAIEDVNGLPSGLREIASDRDCNFSYRVGEMVTEYAFDENRWDECSSGIHFFADRDEAVRYQ